MVSITRYYGTGYHETFFSLFTLCHHYFFIKIFARYYLIFGWFFLVKIQQQCNGGLMGFPGKCIFLCFSLTMPVFHVNATDVVFKCETKNHKQIILQKNIDGVTYSFGKIGEKPELELTRKRKQLETNFENLSGRYLTNTIIITNGAYSYWLTTSVDRIADIQEPSTSLTVTKGEQHLASLKCRKGSEVGALIAIDD